MNCPTENKPFSWPSFFILMCSMFVLVHSRSYYPPKYEEPPPPPTTNRIKLNLGLHVPPIVIKLPRMEMPQMVIGANIIKNPKAKPLTINMPPAPSISFGDPPAPAPKYEMPAGYRAASSQLNPVKVPNEIGFDMKAFGSENHDRSMQAPPSALPPPAPVPMVPGPYPAQYAPPQYQPYAQQAAPQPPMMYPPMMPMAQPPSPQMYPSSMMAMPPQMPTPMQSYPMQQPYYYPPYPMAESQSQPPTMEPQFNPQAYQSRQGVQKRPEWSNMIQAQESLMPPPMYQTPPAPKSPFQLIKNPGQGQRFGLKPNEQMFDDSALSEADMESEDLGKEYNAAPKILMHRFQKV